MHKAKKKPGQCLSEQEQTNVVNAYLLQLEELKRAGSNKKPNISAIGEQFGIGRDTVRKYVRAHLKVAASASAPVLVPFVQVEPALPPGYTLTVSATNGEPDSWMRSYYDWAQRTGADIPEDIRAAVEPTLPPPEPVAFSSLTKTATPPAVIGQEMLDIPDGSIYKVIVTPDAQLPYEDPVAMSAVEQYAADNHFDEWVDLGDFLDLDFLSRHNEGKHRLNAGKFLSEHYAYGREVLNRRLKILRSNNPKAKFTLLEGNHDFRPEAFADKNPAMQGLIEVEAGLELEEKRVDFIRCWRDGTVYRVGKMLYTHGLYISRYHAAKMVETWCDNITYGHTHDVMQFPKIMHGRDKVIVGQSLGCLCRYDQSYIKENPKNWQQAFGIYYFFPSGHFTYYVPRIIDGRFVAPDGKVYTGKR